MHLRFAVPLLAYLAVAVLACTGENQSLDTRGLSSLQIESAAFLDREAFLDMRDVDEETAGEVWEPMDVLRFSLEDGWRPPEPEGTWGLGDRSSLSVYLTDPTDLQFYMEVRSTWISSVRIAVNDVEVADVGLGTEWGRQLLPVVDRDSGESLLRAGVNRVTFEYLPPMAERTTPDLVSAQFRAIGFLAAAPNDGAAPADAREPTPAGVRVSRPGRLVVPIQSRQPVTSVSVRSSSEARPWRPARGTVRLSVDEVHDQVPPTESNVSGLWGQPSAIVDLPMSGYAGPACLVADVSIDADGPPLDVEIAPDVLPLPAPIPKSGQAEQPDIIVIMLDAARADHVGAYGYERNTTPNIDRLAAESLIFEQAYATAAYTMSSVPSLLTGLSFVQHGVTSREHALAEAVPTLAEHLQEAGYQTFCYSANPHHAIGTGMAQGCNTFTELWRRTPERQAIVPYRLSERAIDDLDGASPDQPVFMMLHYIPPHVPYLPPPRFDIFGDDGYDGPVTGRRLTLRQINRGELDPTPEDLHEIVALYDGMLLTGDDAVGQVLDALRQRERWDETVVLVVADHGEAFGEHGWMGHNRSVYDEMLRVPFILRLPGGEQPAEVNTSDVVSLLDVMPTLLGLAGITPRGPTIGQDLLRPSPPQTRRFVVSRTEGDSPIYSYRTRRWKLHIGRGQTRALYDVERDPDELTNLYPDRFETFACLSTLLRWELSDVDPASAAAEALELDEEDLRTLRSLGYVR